TCLAFAQVTSIRFVHAHFKLPRPSRGWWFALALMALTALPLGNSFRAMRMFPLLAAAFLLCSTAHQLRVLVRVVRHAESPEIAARAAAFVASLVVLILSVWPDFLWFFGYGEALGGLHTTALGLTLFPLIQAIALSREHSAVLAHAERLNLELGERVEML